MFEKISFKSLKCNHYHVSFDHKFHQVFKYEVDFTACAGSLSLSWPGFPKNRLTKNARKQGGTGRYL